MKILIVGAGIAGLSLAAFLREKGFDPAVVEQTKKWQTIGYVLGIWPNGLKMLEELNISEKIKKNAAILTGHTVTNNEGKLLRRTNFKGLEKKHGPIIEIDRDKLQKALLSINKKTNIRMNTKYVSLQQKNNKVEVKFSNGKKEIFDLVIGADGINSLVRKSIEPKVKPDYSGFTFWFFWCKNVFNFPKGVIFQCGNGKLFAVFPSNSKSRITVLFGMPAKEHSFNISTKNKDYLLKNFSDMKGDVPKVLKHLPMNPTSIFHHDDDEVHLNLWYKGRVVLMGDSAHALSPLIGMGASMAMEDAFVLHEEISQYGQIENALALYEKRRQKRVSFFQKQSKQIHWLLSLKSPFDKPRNLLIKYIFGPILYKSMDKVLSEDI